ncbi:Gfo/Idh/MocA family oxidoreductase [Carboxylicivirga sediminis]|uniref:Gfo/Idh/MocA family oxidoreductase n=1 Tax=Carboxylicivirga sediminis TaxID=2006564 RepID=A0A941F102_9BACT|nr:Gfo/Idh/MocA family oxidoreductase [Carboxylicivirga sediminis]MBR8534452.1 Gfo/Idh/MocA family oxidoreductase [Carboxylicivirga sediminis]
MDDNKRSYSRRDIVKTLATVPVLGAFAYALLKKTDYQKQHSFNMADELGLKLYDDPEPASISNGQTIRLGIIGAGGRGRYLLEAAGFAHPNTLKHWYEQAQLNSSDTRYGDFIEQDDLNIEIRGVCDIFDVNAKEALLSCSNQEKSTELNEVSSKVKRYTDYRDLLAAADIDAVIIATPDHWHAQMGIDAAKAGKHIYIEKGLTRTIEEAFALRKAVKESGVVFQLGHQGRQTASFKKAKQLVDKNVLGKISLIEVCTNRNDPNGAWVYPIHPDANEQTIDWQQFIEPTNNHPFSAERFFRWRCWWDYGTGLAGDLLTHEYDAINQVMQLGIPHSAVASGGIYFYKDGREVPDVFQAVFEYPERDLTFMYSASLANDHYRGKVLMGHDATMKMENVLEVYPDNRSTQYRKQLDAGLISPDKPMITYQPGKNSLDGYSSATEQYFASRGLLYTHVKGKRVNTAHLHIKEWLNGIRSNKQPSCDIHQAFEEAVTAHMATIAYRENRKVYWDADKEQLI